MTAMYYIQKLSMAKIIQQIKVPLHREKQLGLKPQVHMHVVKP